MFQINKTCLKLKIIINYNNTNYNLFILNFKNINVSINNIIFYYIKYLCIKKLLQ